MESQTYAIKRFRVSYDGINLHDEYQISIINLSLEFYHAGSVMPQDVNTTIIL